MESESKIRQTHREEGREKTKMQRYGEDRSIQRHRIRGERAY